jgi:ubiquinone/menaquinone biosynthesis C-methylase UbiE
VSVGHTGRVYAVEVQKGLVKKFESELKNKGITNVDVIWGDIEKVGGMKLADKSVDRVIISNVLSQAEDKLGLVDEAKRILKPGGLALVIDLTGEHLSQARTRYHIVGQDKAEELFIKRGFKLKEIISTDAHHYGIIFRHE